MGGAELDHGKSERGEQWTMPLDGVLLDANVEKGGVGRKSARVVVFVAMGREQIGAVGGAVDGDFALRAAADGADFFRPGGTKARGVTFLADRTSHPKSSGSTRLAALPQQNRRCGQNIT